jgi:hypothetical protein
MNLATLHLSGSDASLDSVVAALKLNVVSRVRIGDPRRRGGVHDSASLSASLANADTPAAMLREIRFFLGNCQALGPTLFGDGVTAELSIGVSVGDSVQYVSSVDLSALEIRQIANIGIGLNFTAYPTSDEVNEGAKVA